jgi:hypothetical protein
MKSKTILIGFSAMALSSLLALGGLFVGSSYAQENVTTATNETGQ